MQHLGHSLVGDIRYPNLVVPVNDDITDICNIIMPYQALHAQTLGFVHPITQQALNFSVVFPEHFVELQQYFEK
jgi:23S rRNA pseudouridine1911/1915/1917 synthase